MKRRIYVRRHLRKGRIVRNHNRVIKVANKVKNRLKPYTYKIEIAGSIRRKKEPSKIKDVDIVLIPKDKEQIKNQLKKMNAKFKTEGKKQIFTVIDGIDVDLFQTDSGSFGGELLTRTGPANYNIGLRKKAQEQNKILNQYGLFDLKTGKKLAGKTEAGIYRALGRPKVRPPEKR